MPAAFSRANPAWACSGDGCACSDSGPPAASTLSRNGRLAPCSATFSAPSAVAASVSIHSTRSPAPPVCCRVVDAAGRAGVRTEPELSLRAAGCRGSEQARDGRRRAPGVVARGVADGYKHAASFSGGGCSKLPTGWAPQMPGVSWPEDSRPPSRGGRRMHWSRHDVRHPRQRLLQLREPPEPAGAGGARRHPRLSRGRGEAHRRRLLEPCRVPHADREAAGRARHLPLRLGRDEAVRELGRVPRLRGPGARPHRRIRRHLRRRAERPHHRRHLGLRIAGAEGRVDPEAGQRRGHRRLRPHRAALGQRQRPGPAHDGHPRRRHAGPSTAPSAGSATPPSPTSRSSGRRTPPTAR